MHERRAIREAIRTQLTGETAAGARVFETRQAPLRTDELPAIAIYTEDESVDPASGSTAPRELRRTVNIAIEAWARAAADVDDVLDELALEIETAMDSDLEFGGTAYHSVLLSTEVGLKLDGDRPMGAIRLVYAVTYHTDLRVGEPEDLFDKAEITYNLENAQHEDDQAHDTLEDIHED